MKITLGTVTVVADGPAIMMHTPPMLAALTAAGYDPYVALGPAAAVFASTFFPSLLTNHSSQSWPLPASLYATKNHTVLLAPCSMGMLMSMSSKARAKLEASPAQLILAPALLPSDDRTALLAKWARLAGPRWLIAPPDQQAMSLGLLGEIHVASPDVCLEFVRQAHTPQELAGKHILITAGPTVEDIDPVRFISNRSTGRMGVALARIAARQGATVTVVHGPLAYPLPSSPRITSVPVRSAEQMHNAVMQHVSKADIAILCAAVADYAPAQYSESKLKKTAGDHAMPEALQLKRTPDILAHIASLPKKPFLIGFAAESDNVEENAQYKLHHKGCDIICANDISEPGSGFAVATNRVTVFMRDGNVFRLPQMTKDDVARKILEFARQQLQRNA